MSTLDDLRALNAPIDDSLRVARFISVLALSGEQKAHLLRGYLRETRKRLTREILVAARDYSFYL